MAVPRPRPSATEATGTTRRRTRRTKTDPVQDADETRGSRGTRGAAPPPPEDVPPRTASPRPAARKGSMEARLEEFLAAATLPFAVAGDDYSAQIIALRSPALARSLADLARENRAVARILNRIMEGSAWGGVAIASLSIIIPICQHHNLIPGSDPFAAIMPAPSASAEKRMRWGGGSSPVPEGSSMGAPGPGSGGDTPPDRSASPEGDYTPTVNGSPPGVVTVAASAAQHQV